MITASAHLQYKPRHKYGKSLAADYAAMLLRQARLLRVGRHLSLALDLVRTAQADWPALLADAPGSVRRAVIERLRGGVALTA